MTEEIRALVFIFVIVTVPIYMFMRYAAQVGYKHYAQKWIAAWVLTTLLAFLSPNFWVYAVFLSIGLLYFTQKNPIMKISLFFVLIPSLPAATVQIPGFGLINYLFYIGHHHVLIIVLLLPLMLKKSRCINKNKAMNILVIAFFLLITSIDLRDTSFTDTLRQGTMLAITMLIPFFVIRKSIERIEDLQTIMLAAIFGILLQATIGIAETLKGWHLYYAAVDSLGIDWGFGGYMSRNNLLRASAALGHPIILGYISAIGLGLFLNFYPKEQKKLRPMFWIGVAAFVGGLVATLSRGPWVGAAAMVLVFILTGQKAVGKIAKLSMAGFLALAVLSVSPAGQSFIELIPFVSSDEESHAVSTISYRQQLLEQSWIVIQQNPLLGSANYRDTPEMESMRQGEGIIDIVNSYLQITLNSGLIGLGLFLLIFIIPLIRLYKLQSILKKNVRFKSLIVINRTILSTIIGIMVTIFTVSGIGVIQIYYWSILGLACAFLKLARIEVLQHITSAGNHDPDTQT
jgi:O-antigen ligase